MPSSGRKSLAWANASRFTRAPAWLACGVPAVGAVGAVAPGAAGAVGAPIDPAAAGLAAVSVMGRSGLRRLPDGGTRARSGWTSGLQLWASGP
jgi:hypothetical protein